MEVLHPRCAGLDVHKDSVVAAVRLAATGTVHTEVRRFDATTPGLLALAAWLAECGCTHAAMEATGWRRPGCTGSRCGTCCPTAIWC
jgi:transposase